MIERLKSSLLVSENIFPPTVEEIFITFLLSKTLRDAFRCQMG